MPSRIVIDKNETYFAIWGERGILVGEFPTMLQNLRQKRDDVLDL